MVVSYNIFKMVEIQSFPNLEPPLEKKGKTTNAVKILNISRLNLMCTVYV